jgi:hypothetical protein
MRLALYLMFMGVACGGLGALARLAVRVTEPGTPNTQLSTFGLDIFAPILYYGGLAALTVGVLLGLGQLVVGLV